MNIKRLSPAFIELPKDIESRSEASVLAEVVDLGLAMSGSRVDFYSLLLSDDTLLLVVTPQEVETDAVILQAKNRYRNGMIDWLDNCDAHWSNNELDQNIPLVEYFPEVVAVGVVGTLLFMASGEFKIEIRKVCRKGLVRQTRDIINWFVPFRVDYYKSTVQCPGCLARFANDSPELLKKHLQNSHNLLTGMLLPCPIPGCSMSFTQETIVLLDDHIIKCHPAYLNICKRIFED